MTPMRKAIVAGIAGLGAMASAPTVAVAQDEVVREYHSYSYESDRDDDDDWGEHRRYRDRYDHDEPVEYRRSSYYHEDRPRYDRRYRESRHHRDNCRSNGTAGAIVGGALGALLGRGIDRYGDRTTGTILGAGGGAVVGHEIDSKRHC